MDPYYIGGTTFRIETVKKSHTCSRCYETELLKGQKRLRVESSYP